MTDYTQYFMAAIEWGLVPIILAIIFLYGLTLSPVDSSYKSSTRAGKLSGLILFVIFVITQQGKYLKPSFLIPKYGLKPIPLLLGVAGGFFFSKMINILLKTRLVGIVAMFLVSGSLITMYTYVFLSFSRPTLVFVALGIALGSLLETLFFERDIVTSGGK
jgi:hypothetical protein